MLFKKLFNSTRMAASTLALVALMATGCALDGDSGPLGLTSSGPSNPVDTNDLSISLPLSEFQVTSKPSTYALTGTCTIGTRYPRNRAFITLTVQSNSQTATRNLDSVCSNGIFSANVTLSDLTTTAADLIRMRIQLFGIDSKGLQTAAPAEVPFALRIGADASGNCGSRINGSTWESVTAGNRELSCTAPKIGRIIEYFNLTKYYRCTNGMTSEYQAPTTVVTSTNNQCVDPIVRAEVIASGTSHFHSQVLAHDVTWGYVKMKNRGNAPWKMSTHKMKCQALYNSKLLITEAFQVDAYDNEISDDIAPDYEGRFRVIQYPLNQSIGTAQPVCNQGNYVYYNCWMEYNGTPIRNQDDTGVAITTTLTYRAVNLCPSTYSNYCYANSPALGYRGGKARSNAVEAEKDCRVYALQAAAEYCTGRTTGTIGINSYDIQGYFPSTTRDYNCEQLR